MKPLIYGYLRLTDDLDDHEIRRMEQGLQELAEAGGFCFATTFHEYQTGYHGGFDELTHELQRAHAHHVVVPSLEHLSGHPLLQDMMLAHLAREAGAYVWVVARRDGTAERAAASRARRVSVGPIGSDGCLPATSGRDGSDD